ncbi:MAG: HemK2/MTQ2 family protein methyltransferase [Promethearchaeota archaeon]
MIIFNYIPDPLIEGDIENVYFPSEDTYLLIDYFKKNINDSFFDGIDVNKIDNILDLGTGTGIIAIFLQYIKSRSKTFNPRIFASDILDEAIVCAKNNEVLNNFQNEIVFLQSDLFKAFPNYLKSSINIIIFNPPYLPSSALINENKNKKKIDFSWDGGIRGYETIIDFFKEVRDFLNVNHYIYYISSNRIDLNELDKCIHDFGFKNEKISRRHLFFEDIFLNRARIL